MTRLRRTNRPHRSRGFTLIESAIVTAVVGLGVLAMMQLLAAGSVVNAEGAELTTAINLANNVHEMSAGMAFYDPQSPGQWSTKEATLAQYDNVLDLDNETFQPPLDVSRGRINEFAEWAQVVTVESVASNDLDSVRPGTVSEPTARVTVKVTRNGNFVYQTSWVTTAPQ